MKEFPPCTCSSCISNPIHCFHCNSPDFYWHWELQRWECVDCGSYIDSHGGVAKGGDYLKGCVKILGMIRS